MDIGVDHISFCLEFVEPEWFAKICPGKEKVLGQQIFFDSIAYCAKRMNRGAVSGEIIAGVEPLEATMQGIDWIAAQGAFPTVCIFRPTVGADMEQWPSPAYEDMRRVMAHVVRRVPPQLDPDRRGARTSRSASSSTPTTPRCWRRATPASTLFEAYRRAARVAARPLFARRMRPRPRRESGGAGEIPPATGGGRAPSGRENQLISGHFRPPRAAGITLAFLYSVCRCRRTAGVCGWGPAHVGSGGGTGFSRLEPAPTSSADYDRPREGPRRASQAFSRRPPPTSSPPPPTPSSASATSGRT